MSWASRSMQPRLWLWFSATFQGTLSKNRYECQWPTFMPMAWQWLYFRYTVTVKCVNPMLGSMRLLALRIKIDANGCKMPHVYMCVLCPSHHVLNILNDPRCAFGAPLSRRRLFIIMVQTDVLKNNLQEFESFDMFWDDTCARGEIEPDTKWYLAWQSDFMVIWVAMVVINVFF